MANTITPNFNIWLPVLVFTILLALTATASAEPDYSAEQVVEFFLGSASAAPTRGICVGTVKDCSPAQRPSQGFDILVNFEHDSAILSSKARTNLIQIAGALKDPRLSTTRFVVEGHTDALGTEAYNIRLSELRARAVTAFLIQNGVISANIVAVGVGENSPRSEDTLDPVNRRVEIHISFQER